MISTVAPDFPRSRLRKLSLLNLNINDVTSEEFDDWEKLTISCALDICRQNQLKEDGNNINIFQCV